VQVDESIGDEPLKNGFFGIAACVNKGYLDGRYDTTSTEENPIIYLYLTENDEKRAFLVDINRIDLSNMTRMESLTLTYLLEEQTMREYGRFEDIPHSDAIAELTISDLSVDFLNRNPWKDPDFQFPSLCEKINFFDELKTEYVENGWPKWALSEMAREKVDSYISKIESDTDGTAFEIISKIQKLLCAVAGMFDINDLDRPEVNAATRMKGIEDLGRILGVDIKSDVAAWLGPVVLSSDYLKDLKTYGGLGNDDSDFSMDTIKQALIAGKASQASQESSNDLLSAWDDFFEARDARYHEAQKNGEIDVNIKSETANVITLTHNQADFSTRSTDHGLL
jgi:hypothetical protein